MINAIDTEALARIIPRNLPGFYEFSKLDDGTVIIIRKPKVLREGPLVDGEKREGGPGPGARLIN